jgi:glucose-6-phosphate isomerase
VGLYASPVGINAYHQPGVEASKQAAASVLALQTKALAALSTTPQTAEQVAAALGSSAAAETVFLLLEHLAAKGRASRAGPGDPGTTMFLKR